MINVATDCYSDLGPSDWERTPNWQLVEFAKNGNHQQKTSLIDWAHSNVPAWIFEELYYIVHGEEWVTD